MTSAGTFMHNVSSYKKKKKFNVLQLSILVDNNFFEMPPSYNCICYSEKTKL